MTQQEAYSILGLSVTATQEEVKKAYREQCKRFHPDDNSSREALEQYLLVQKAYQWIAQNIHFSTLQSQPHIYGNVTSSTRRTGKVVGGWQVSEPNYSEQQYRQMQLRKLEEERKKKKKEEEEKQKKILEAMQKARKLPSEREAEKWKKIEVEREAQRIAKLIKQLMELGGE